MPMFDQSLPNMTFNLFEAGIQNAVYGPTAENAANTDKEESFGEPSPTKIKKSTGKVSGRKTNYGGGATLILVDNEKNSKKRYRDEDFSDPTLDAVVPETQEQKR